MERKIAAVGDSHSLRCFENHELIADSKAYFGYNKLDGKTAYKLKDHDKRVRKIITPIKNKHLIFVFGEVDVRIHIKRKHLQLGTPVETLIQNTAKRYTDYVAGLREEGFDIHIFNVVPTGNFIGPQFETWKKRLKYDFNTTFKERQSYTLMLNKESKNHCRQKAIPFINIYKHLIDEQGHRKKELVFDFSHINSKTADILMENYHFEHALEPAES